MKTENEYIICAAIWYDDGKEHTHMPVPYGFITAGHRHHNCIAGARVVWEAAGKTLENFHETVNEVCQGFLTSKGRFVDRRQGMAIAYDAGQVEYKRAFSVDPSWFKENIFDTKAFIEGEPKRIYEKGETPYNRLYSEDLY